MSKIKLSRRSFLRLSALAGMVPATLNAADSEVATSGQVHSEAMVGSYVRLGKTELKISDVSFGSSRLRDGQEDLVRHALEKGINYFDTAESYTGSSSEKVIGKALQGVRDKVYIATKTSAGSSTSADSIMRALEQSLVRLRTDYVDVFFNHAVNSVSRLKNEQWFEFVEKAKTQGKIRFTGISGHAGRLTDCLEYSLENDLFDVILVATNFGEDPAFYEKITRRFDLVAKQPELPRLMQKAREKDVGVIAMKVLRGAKLNDMKPFETDGASYSQAALRWILNNEHVDAAIISMTAKDEIDEYLGASSSQQVSHRDTQLLQQYATMTSAAYCRPVCDDCEGSCPYGVGIADVMRTRMYAVDYGDPEFGKSEYRMLASDASACLSCDGQACQNACTYSLPIASLCASTHELLA